QSCRRSSGQSPSAASSSGCSSRSTRNTPRRRQRSLGRGGTRSGSSSSSALRADERGRTLGCVGGSRTRKRRLATVLIPIPERDFDPTEVAVSWKVLGELGHEVRFATPEGRASRGDELMVRGGGLVP